MKHDFADRRPMSYRGALRRIPKPLHRRWWAMRMRYGSPRVQISRAWLPASVRRNVTVY